MITLYFSELDEASHDHPLESPEIVKAAQSLDTAIGQLVDGIDKLPVRDQVYLVITSDHGMVNTSTGADRPARFDPGRRGERPASRPASADRSQAAHLGRRRTRPRDSRSHQRAVARGTAYLRQDLPARFNYATIRETVTSSWSWTRVGR